MKTAGTPLPWNVKLMAEGKDPVNTRRVTNLGTFRVYIGAYLKAHPGVNQDMIQMVRQLQTGSTGIPLEIYCFAATTAWVAYEGIQADIFDHLLAVLPEFGLREFQSPMGADLRAWAPAGREVADTHIPVPPQAGIQ